MSLTTTHGAWSGSSTAFNQWRSQLARTAGYELDSTGRPALDWISATDQNLNGDWDSIPLDHQGAADPLLILLVHHDDAGHIRSMDTGPLADRIEQLLPHLDAPSGYWSLHEDTERFIAGLRRAHASGEPVTFH